jgi:hypothetical protein
MAAVINQSYSIFCCYGNSSVDCCFLLVSCPLYNLCTRCAIWDLLVLQCGPCAEHIVLGFLGMEDHVPGKQSLLRPTVGKVHQVGASGCSSRHVPGGKGLGKSRGKACQVGGSGH